VTTVKGIFHIHYVLGVSPTPILWRWVATRFADCVTFLFPCDKWVPVTRALRVLRLQMEERPLIWRVPVNILNKQSRTAEKGWSSSLGAGQSANNSSLLQRILLRNSHTDKASDLDW